MSTHKECGEDITWARREDDTGWRPPLEFVGQAYILTDGPNGGDRIAIQVATYKSHNCDPDKVLAWLEYKEKLAAIEARGLVTVNSKTDWEIAREKRREELWEEALAFECTDCGATIGEYCTSRAKGPRYGKTLRNPHSARVKLVEDGEGA